jgi:hypothetical protein
MELYGGTVKEGKARRNTSRNTNLEHDLLVT